MEQPRIQFKKLKGFPKVDEEKVQTVAFLEAATEIVSVLETFGKLFSPVISDMNGNILDEIKYEYLEDMITLNVNVDNFAANALLWLKRGLQLICKFFENIFHDKQNTESLKHHLQNAYENTLKPYHGFLVQSTVKIIYSWVPSRTQLIGNGAAHDENLEVLEIFLPIMRKHLNRIDILLKKYNLDDASKP
ncbi:pleckstrin homology domain-containing family A member 8 isoform X2 [Teleopsis dalmanni]|uniref:pleckstrin homology domain-containing family A member 8 isoform X2 n=1 Tax=Teleopsis dalmanni TaxID=139649 RepID=UPI0018CCCC41|nr:pleckstrin homology domain-containing family A member 8 isoform X2 [Teleopsis dalmanni]